MNKLWNWMSPNGFGIPNKSNGCTRCLWFHLLRTLCAFRNAVLDSLDQEREKRASCWFSNWSSFVMLNGSNDLLHALRDLLKPETSRGHRRKSPLHCWATSFRMNGNHQPDALLPWCNVISWIQKWGMWSLDTISMRFYEHRSESFKDTRKHWQKPASLISFRSL